MKILFISDYLPYPITYGAAVRVYNFIKHLAKSHSVSLIAFGAATDPPEARQHMEQLCERVVLVQHHIAETQRRRQQLRAAISRYSSMYYQYYCPNFQEQLNDLLQAENYDCVQLEFSFMAYYQLQTKAFTCLDEHNVEFNLQYRFLQQETNWARRIYRFLEYRKQRAEEIKLAGRFEHVLYPSEVDANFMRSYLPNPVSVIPNGVDIDYFQANSQTNDGHFLYFGAMNYGPNIDGVRYFAQSIWPLIRQRRPEAVFEVVGPHPPAEIKQLDGQNGIRITGEVADIRAAIQPASVVVVPLRVGSGTRLKILESLAMGKAVVTTSIGCEGIKVANQTHLAVADTPTEFADYCLQLDDSQSLRRALGQNGRALVEAQYSWKAICEDLQRIYLSA